MASNVQLFKQFLDSEQLHPETWTDEDGDTYFEFQQKLKSGPNGKMIVIFGKDDLLVSIYLLDCITLSNSTKIDNIYRYLNELNTNYTYYKFSMDKNNNVILSSFVPFNNNFSPEVILRLLIGSLNIMDEEYPNIMKVIWS